MDAPHYHSIGYDIVDDRAIDPDYRNLADLDALIADADQLGLKVVLDALPNYTSDQHASSPTSTRGRVGRLGCGGQ